MPTPPRLASVLAASFLCSIGLHGQGSLLPTGAPGPTQKSLQEIWDRLGTVEASLGALQQRQSALLSQVATLVDSSGSTSYQDTFQELLPWRYTFVGVQASMPSLKFGPDGYPAIAYAGELGRLHLARFDGTDWNVTLVDPLAVGVHHVSLAFGPEGRPAIGYVGNGTLRVAQFDGADWHAVTAGPAATYASLAFGPDGHPHLAYCDEGGVHFARHGERGLNVWVSETVETGSNVSHASLAFDSDGQPSIAYYLSNGYLRFARHGDRSLDPWVATTIDASGDVVYFASLAYGPDGYPAITYPQEGNPQDGSAQDLRFARFDGSDWTRETIESVGEIGASASLNFGPDGHPAIAFFANEGALFTRYDGTAWSRTIVRPPAVEDAGISLAFGPDGQPAVAWQTPATFADPGEGPWVPVPGVVFAQRYVPAP